MENNEGSSRTAAGWFSGRTESALMLRSRAHARGVSKHEGDAVLILRDGAARLLRMRTSKATPPHPRAPRRAARARRPTRRTADRCPAATAPYVLVRFHAPSLHI